MYIHHSLSYKLLLEAGPYKLEFSALSLKTKCSHNNCSIYLRNHPSSPAAMFANLCTMLQLIHPVKFSNFVLIVDLNINFDNSHGILFSY